MKLEQPVDNTDAARAKAVADNRATVAGSRIGSWLPRFWIKRAGPSLDRGASRSSSAATSTGPASSRGSGMLSVLTIDLTKGLAPVDSVGVMTDARIVYASPRNLYVATERWDQRPLPATPTVAPSTVTTQIHRFDISDPDRTQYRGSGQVSGYLLDQWALSENDGVLRVVSTDAPAWWTEHGRRLELVVADRRCRSTPARLTPVGQVGGLGQGERVYAVRYVGDTAYVVTFKQIDPLYTARPRATRRVLASSASSSCPGTPRTCTRSAATSCSVSASTSAATRTSSGRRSRCSTSQTPPTRHSSLARPSARGTRRPSRTTTRSCSGREPACS